MTARAALGIAAFACALSCATERPGTGVAAAPRIEYRLAFDPAVRDAAWRVEVRGHGLASVSGLVLELDNWGEWTSVDSYYLRALDADPPLRRVEDSRNTFTVAAPDGWSGELRVSYELPTAELGSGAREHHGLLPYRAATYSFGFSANTLLRVAWDDMPAIVDRTITIEAPADWTIATGLAGTATGRQIASIGPTISNTVISFGRPRGVRRGEGAIPVEVVQWGGADDVTAQLLRFAQTYLAACAATTGSAPSGPVHLVVTEPGFGGTRVDGAIAMGCPSGLESGDAGGGTLHFVAHELFHDWLGGRLTSATHDESLCWFWEGFTDYLSLWHLAKTGLVSRAWFAERLTTIDQIASQAPGRDEIAYADASVRWRDPEIEPLAYQGSALVAFAADVALRRAGKPGLVEMIRDFQRLPGGRYSLADIRAWMQSHGLGDLWRERFEKAPPHTLREDLIAIGYVERDAPEPLAYVGVRLEGDGVFGTVAAVDPEGPAAGLVEVGDRVSGLTPTRREHPVVPAGVAPSYRFGLQLYDPAAARVRVDVERAGEHRQVWVRPRVIEGGVVRRMQPNDERLDAFFR